MLKHYVNHRLWSPYSIFNFFSSKSLIVFYTRLFVPVGSIILILILYFLLKGRTQNLTVASPVLCHLALRALINSWGFVFTVDRLWASLCIILFRRFYYSLLKFWFWAFAQNIKNFLQAILEFREVLYLWIKFTSIFLSNFIKAIIKHQWECINFINSLFRQFLFYIS